MKKRIAAFAYVILRHSNSASEILVVRRSPRGLPPVLQQLQAGKAGGQRARISKERCSYGDGESKDGWRKVMFEDSALQFAWEVVASSNDGPGPRSRHCLVYDSVDKATILFGGIVWDEGESLYADTWKLQHGEWSRVTCPKSPPARHRGTMTFDPLRGNSVLFGGQGQLGNFLRDTWTYSNGRWRKWSGGWLSTRPSARCGHSMTFDETTGEIVLFGGIGWIDRPLGDTWLFDGSSWRPVTGPGPPPRRYAAFAYDPTLQGCVLHGGAEDDRGYRMFGDAWLFKNNTWKRLGKDFDTDARDDHGLWYHREAKRLVMLEGVRGARGVLVREASGWGAVKTYPLHPRHQCSPLVWDDELGGLLLHGGEVHHGGDQFDTTLLLRRRPAS